mgnify:CR=1 FL=1
MVNRVPKSASRRNPAFVAASAVASTILSSGMLAPAAEACRSKVRRDRRDQREIDARTREPFDLGREKIDNRRQIAAP